ncbi:kinase domain protein (macronuclear) [Tetrahymena thermophila SB210]|uniref:Kinase domain protein n=1 Tax=Tetrahymena thermophila (strain SB210) TaxID=312017 RepID=I7MFQ4_TETTS|nr:kinase domain protein [Tetrahymena thermophila SB210]EAS00428.2 kinase domain protein [Tetrahymena thermophila SB210]|eukprot:XP_001020673.2 kinase domain protein [Tetrahymena thermophila SB210]
MSSSTNNANANKQSDGMPKGQVNQQTSSQSNSLGLAQQVQQQKELQQSGGRVQACPDGSQPVSRRNSNNHQNDKQQPQAKNGNQQGSHVKEVNVNYSDDEIHINPDLEKFFKKREFIEQIQKPMLRSSQDRFGDVKSAGSSVGAQQSVNNQRRALHQMGLISKQESNNEATKLNKLKRYSDKLSNAIKSLQQWEEPLVQMGVAKTPDERFENAEKVLNRWQDLGLIDGPDTEQMMMKYPEYENELQNEKINPKIKNNHNSNHFHSDKYNQSLNNFNRINKDDVDQDQEIPKTNFKIRNNRDGSQTNRYKNGTGDLHRQVQQSPRLNTEKNLKEELQQHSLQNNMFTPQNKLRKSSQQNPKRNLNMLDEQIIKNLNENKFLEDQKNQIMANNLNHQHRPQYQQKLLSNTQPIAQNNLMSSSQNEYGTSPNINNSVNGHILQARPRLRTPKKSEKLNAPPEYNEAITNEIEKQYRMRYSSAEPHTNNQHNLYDSTPGNSYQKYGTSFLQPQSTRKDTYANTHRSGDENEVSSLFPQIHNFSETFRLTSGGKLKNSMNQSRAETPKRKTNYVSTAYPHATLMGNQIRGSTPKYQNRNQL